MIFMAHTIALGGGVWLAGIAVIAYGASQLNLTAVSIGAVLTTALPVIQFYVGQTQAEQRNRMERVASLDEPVFDPLSGWAKDGIDFLSVHSPKEIWSDNFSMMPRVERRSVYARVGLDFGGKLLALKGKYDGYIRLRYKLIDEYRDRIINAVQRIDPNWVIQNVSVSHGDATTNISDGNVADLAQRQSLENVQRIVAFPWVRLSHDTPPTATVDCSPEFRALLSHTDDLASYSQYIVARTEFSSELKRFSDEIDYVIQNGGRDW
jgi:hypothetical protein